MGGSGGLYPARTFLTSLAGISGIGCVGADSQSSRRRAKIVVQPKVRDAYDGASAGAKTDIVPVERCATSGRSSAGLILEAEKDPDILT